MNYVYNVLYRSSFCFALFFASFLGALSIPTQRWIVVHGTFAANSEWHKETSQELAALTKTLTETTQNRFTLHSFCWSGQHNHPARLKAAEEFLLFLEKLTPPYHIVAHSHGVTVVLLAAQKLFEQKKTIRIAEIFALGAPLYQGWYPDASKQIDTLYNLFSYGDTVQTIMSLFRRTFPTAPHVHNLQIKVNYNCPRHSELHNPEILAQLPKLRTLITVPANYLLHIQKGKNGMSTALLQADTTREKDLVTDHHFTEQLISLYGESRYRKDLLVRKILSPSHSNFETKTNEQSFSLPH